MMETPRVLRPRSLGLGASMLATLAEGAPAAPARASPSQEKGNPGWVGPKASQCHRPQGEGEGPLLKVAQAGLVPYGC